MFGSWSMVFCQVPSRKVTQSSADGPLLVLPFILCVPSGFVTSEDAPLVIKDRLAGVNFFPAALSLDHRIDKTFEFLTPPAIDAKPMQRIRMHEANFGGNSARQTGLEHGLRFGQGVGANHSGDMETDSSLTQI